MHTTVRCGLRDLSFAGIVAAHQDGIRGPGRQQLATGGIGLAQTPSISGPAAQTRVSIGGRN